MDEEARRAAVGVGIRIDGPVPGICRASRRADQRIKDIGVPLLVLNAADDPIAQYNVKAGVFDAETLAANPNLVVAVTAAGGHLGWCDSDDPCGPPGWAQNVALDFLEAARETA